MPFVGEPITLSHQLPTGNNDRFVRATVFTPAGAVFATITLTNIGLGKYTDGSLVYPAAHAYLEVTYEVFLNAGLTQPDPVHLNGTSKFERQTLINSTTLTVLERLTGKVTSPKLIGKMFVDNNRLQGRLTLNNVLRGRVVAPVIRGEIVQSNVIKGILKECE